MKETNHSTIVYPLNGDRVFLSEIEILGVELNNR